MSETVITHADNSEPNAFTRAEIGWAPWLAPLPESELTLRHQDGLVDPSRAKSPYFMLLVRDPDVLAARTKTDKDIFYNVADGLPRAERELAATATSRFNGCIFCASVHARFAAHHAGRGEDIDRLLADGTSVDLGERWNAIVDASIALSCTPPTFGETEVVRLRSVGLSDAEISDVIHGAAFFNWANRLMLSLGEPTPAK